MFMHAWWLAAVSGNQTNDDDKELEITVAILEFDFQIGADTSHSCVAVGASFKIILNGKHTLPSSFGIHYLGSQCASFSFATISPSHQSKDRQGELRVSPLLMRPPLDPSHGRDIGPGRLG
jgi:hypothetical protein